MRGSACPAAPVPAGETRASRGAPGSRVPVGSAAADGCQKWADAWNVSLAAPYEMNLEIALTSWLELMSPWKVTITFPEPIVPGSGWASGSHFRSSAPAPCVNCTGAAYWPALVLLSYVQLSLVGSACGPDPALLGPEMIEHEHAA